MPCVYTFVVVGIARKLWNPKIVSSNLAKREIVKLAAYDKRMEPPLDLCRNYSNILNFVSHILDTITRNIAFMTFVLLLTK